MKVENAQISILIGQDSTTIEVRDANACVTFLRVKLSPEQLSMALSRLANTPCEAEVFWLDKIGKIQENKTFAFEIPSDLRRSSKSDELHRLATEALAQDEEMKGWVADKYFSSQNSFYQDSSGKTFARATIRRWVTNTELTAREG